jgi:hypothetical protein
MPAQRRNRRRPDFTAAFPGRLAKQHKARWLKARDELAKLRVRPAAREMLRALIDLVAKRPHLRRVMVGFGGVKDARHRQRLEEDKARGITPKPGLAELTGMSRSSMIRARQVLASADIDLLLVIPGRGRGNANAYVLRTGDPEAELPPAAPPPEPEQPNEDGYRRFQERRRQWENRGP